MIAVLFARSDSIYKQIPGCDVWDIERDALRWPGLMPVVAHPPCRAWGRLRWAAKPRPGERELAIRAIEAVRCWGGVLEHPKASSLWKAAQLPRPGMPADKWGGYSIEVNQFWWGHRCAKATWLYIKGVPPEGLPEIPKVTGEPTHVVTPSLYRKGHPRWKPHCRKEEREATPKAFAEWLVEVATRAGGIKEDDEEEPEFDPEDVNDYEEDMSESARLRFKIMDAEDRTGTGPDGHSY